MKDHLIFTKWRDCFESHLHGDSRSVEEQVEDPSHLFLLTINLRLRTYGVRDGRADQVLYFSSDDTQFIQCSCGYPQTEPGIRSQGM